MSYSFHDIADSPNENDLPAEAMSYNGVYFEEVIPGYSTLNVSGRETIPVDISDYNRSLGDGRIYKSRRYDARTITVTFQLLAESDSDFRDAFNQLNGYLDAEQAQIIFNDEPDKYFIGTRSAIDDIEPGRNSVTGTIEIYCADPFKYSLEETQVQMDENGEFIFEYGGTKAVHPVFDVQFPEGEDVSDGYIALMNQDGRILTAGDTNDNDNTTVPKSETLIDQSFTDLDTGWNDAARKGWDVNDADGSFTAVAGGFPYFRDNFRYEGSLATAYSYLGMKQETRVRNCHSFMIDNWSDPDNDYDATKGFMPVFWTSKYYWSSSQFSYYSSDKIHPTFEYTGWTGNNGGKGRPKKGWQVAVCVFVGSGDEGWNKQYVYGQIEWIDSRKVRLKNTGSKARISRIASVTEHYAYSDSADSAPSITDTGIWTTNPSSRAPTRDKPYLWNYSTIDYFYTDWQHVKTDTTPFMIAQYTDLAPEGSQITKLQVNDYFLWSVSPSDYDWNWGGWNSLGHSGKPTNQYHYFWNYKRITATYVTNQKAAYLHAGAYGSSDVMAHGPLITRSIPADSYNNAGVKNWTLDVSDLFCLDKDKPNLKENGNLMLVVYNDSKIIFGDLLYKYGSSYHALDYPFTGAGDPLQRMDASKILIDTNYKLSGNKAVEITKSGSVFTVKIGDRSAVYSVPEAENLMATKIGIGFFQYKLNTPMHFIGLSSVKFIADYAEPQQIPNRFSSGDSLQINGQDASITRNDANADDLGAIGNNWETFVISPGINQIRASFSSWMEEGSRPEITLRYREAYI